MDDQLISDDELDALLTQRDPLDSSRFAELSLGPRLVALLDETIGEVGRPNQTAGGWRRLFGIGGFRPRARQQRWTRRSRLVLGFTASAAAVTAVSLIGFNAFGSAGALSSTWFPTVTPAQASELNRVAAAADQHAGPGKGQWLFQRFVVAEGGGTSVGKTQVNFRDVRTVQQWTNANDVQRTRSLFESFSFDSAQDRANFYGADHARFDGLPGVPAKRADAAPGPGVSSRVTDEADPSTGGSPLSAQNMPATALGILNRFHALFDRDPTDYTKDPRPERNLYFAANLFGELAVILADSTSEHQRAAALKAFAYVDGVQVLGTHEDAVGRGGLEIRYVWRGGSGQVTTLIVDRKTGDLLQETIAELRSSGFPAADGFQRTTFLQRAIVSSMEALPDGGVQPYDGLPPRIAKGSK